MLHLRLCDEEIEVEPRDGLSNQCVDEMGRAGAPGGDEYGDHGGHKGHVCEVRPLQQGVAQADLVGHGAVRQHVERHLHIVQAG